MPVDDDVQFLFATMDGALFNRNDDILARAGRALVINQITAADPRAEAEDLDANANDHRLEILNFRERGLARSRNRALSNASASLCYFCDDDIQLSPEAPRLVVEAFERHPDADVLIFERAQSFAPTDRAVRGDSMLPTPLRLLGVSSIQVAFKREAVARKGIQFDERFGLGSEFPSSEEAIFLVECWKSGLRIEWTSEVVATHPVESSGLSYDTPLLAEAKGAVLARLFGQAWLLFALAFAFKSYPLYARHMNPVGFLSRMRRGVARWRRPATTETQRARIAGRELEPQTPLAPPVFDALNAAGIRYCIWKDLDEVPQFKFGNSELDVFVDRKDEARFDAICAAHGFAKFVPRTDIYGGAISHQMHFAEGRYFHLHVHTRLLTGDHYAKEYDLSCLVDDAFFADEFIEGVRVVDGESELMIGAVRLIAKARAENGFKVDELERLRDVFSDSLWKDHLERFSSRIPFSQTAQCTLVQALCGDDEVLPSLAELEPELAGLRRLSPVAASLCQTRLRLSNAFAQWRGLSNKIMQGGAPTIAILGVDGSGKTTLCDALVATFEEKVSVQRFYVGSNSGTYRAFTWGAYGVRGVLLRLQRLMASPQWLEQPIHLTHALLEYAKCRDRVAVIRKANRSAALGNLVIFERYPIKNLFDYPDLPRQVETSEIRLEGWMGSISKRLLSSIDVQLETVREPDASILLHTEYDEIASRRPLGPAEAADIRQKLEKLQRFSPSGRDGLHEIRNAGTAEHTLQTVIEKVNTLLCARNS